MGRPKGGTNQKRSCDDKVQLIEEYYDSGIGYKAFARERGISPSLFCTWLKKYQEGGIEALRHSRQRYNRTEEERDEEILRLKLIIAKQQIEIEELKEKIL